MHKVNSYRFNSFDAFHALLSWHTMSTPSVADAARAVLRDLKWKIVKKVNLNIFLRFRHLKAELKAVSKAVVLPLQKQWFCWSKAVVLLVKSSAFQIPLWHPFMLPLPYWDDSKNQPFGQIRQGESEGKKRRFWGENASCFALKRKLLWKAK